MPSRDPADPEPTPGDGLGDKVIGDELIGDKLIGDELIGLDPDDPETLAFAAHLDRMHRDRPRYTVEGYLEGVSSFAESTNRAQGGRWLAAVVVVLLLLAVSGYLVMDAAAYVLTTLF